MFIGGWRSEMNLRRYSTFERGRYARFNFPIGGLWAHGESRAGQGQTLCRRGESDNSTVLDISYLACFQYSQCLRYAEFAVCLYAVCTRDFEFKFHDEIKLARQQLSHDGTAVSFVL